MGRRTLLRATALSGLVSLALVSGCDRQPASDASSAAAPAAAADQAAMSDPAVSERNDRLLQAAEPYEALTEQAFSASEPDLQKLLEDAQIKSLDTATALDPAAHDRLELLASEADTAIGAGNRSAVALAAVESYKVLVSAQDASAAKVPVEVSLLDYAGFRYDAILKSQPVRWDLMAGDVAYARETWAKIADRVTSPGLKGAFEQALAGMETAVKEKNTGLGRQAAASELALVDLLEEHFAKA